MKMPLAISFLDLNDALFWIFFRAPSLLFKFFTKELSLSRMCSLHFRSWQISAPSSLSVLEGVTVLDGVMILVRLVSTCLLFWPVAMTSRWVLSSLTFRCILAWSNGISERNWYCSLEILSSSCPNYCIFCSFGIIAVLLFSQTSFGCTSLRSWHCCSGKFT